MGFLDRLLSKLREFSPDVEFEREGGDESRSDVGPTIRTKRDELSDILASNGGRMRQADLVSVTDWSAATVSRELAEMDADGIVHKISIGRSNLVALVGAEPDWYSPPESPTDSAAGGPARAGDRAAILLIEDDEADAELLKRAFREADIHNPIHTVRDGFDAVEFLLQRGSYTDAPVPALVLLDLELLVIDGFEVLTELADREALDGCPMIVLSHSEDPEDVRRSYREGATAYLTKPGDLDGLVELASAIEAFWLSDALKQPSESTEQSDRQLVS